MVLSEKEIDELAKSIAQAYVSREDIQKAEAKIFIDTYMTMYESSKNRLKIMYSKKKEDTDNK